MTAATAVKDSPGRVLRVYLGIAVITAVVVALAGESWATALALACGLSGCSKRG